jgi:hypothetical protein
VAQVRVLKDEEEQQENLLFSRGSVEGCELNPWVGRIVVDIFRVGVLVENFDTIHAIGGDLGDIRHSELHGRSEQRLTEAHPMI